MTNDSDPLLHNLQQVPLHQLRMPVEKPDANLHSPGSTSQDAGDPSACLATSTIKTTDTPYPFTKVARLWITHHKCLLLSSQKTGATSALRMKQQFVMWRLHSSMTEGHHHGQQQLHSHQDDPCQHP